MVLVGPSSGAGGGAEAVEYQRGQAEIAVAGGERDEHACIAEADDIGFAVAADVRHGPVIEVVAAPAPGARIRTERGRAQMRGFEWFPIVKVPSSKR